MALHPAVQSLNLRSVLQHGARKWILVSLPLTWLFIAWGSWILAFIQIPDNPVMQKVSGPDRMKANACLCWGLLSSILQRRTKVEVVDEK